MNSEDLTGKVVVVVEGHHGIGKIISKALIENGAMVHILANDHEEAEKVAKEELFMERDEDRIWRASVAPCKTSNISSIILHTNCAKNKYGTVDYLVNPMMVLDNVALH